MPLSKGTAANIVIYKHDTSTKLLLKLASRLFIPTAADSQSLEGPGTTRTFPKQTIVPPGSCVGGANAANLAASSLFSAAATALHSAAVPSTASAWSTPASVRHTTSSNVGSQSSTAAFTTLACASQVERDDGGAASIVPTSPSEKSTSTQTTPASNSVVVGVVVGVLVNVVVVEVVVMEVVVDDTVVVVVVVSQLGKPPRLTAPSIMMLIWSAAALQPPPVTSSNDCEHATVAGVAPVTAANRASAPVRTSAVLRHSSIWATTSRLSSPINEPHSISGTAADDDEHS